MISKIIKTILFGIPILFSINSYGQYYKSEVDPCYLKWKKIVDNQKGMIIFPDYIEDKAYSVSFYRDTLSNYISYNLNRKKRRFPITLHPTNMLSNGMVTYTPQRMELFTMPSLSNYSLPWLKQLVAHEYRHVAQLSNLDQGFTKVVSYILGEQMLGITAIILPSFFYEGDAVVAETQFAMFGRGRQPSFNIALRADLQEGKKFNPHKYKLGAINQFTPDSYLMGYYFTQYATQHFGDQFWEKSLRYVARNPFLIDPLSFAYKKYGKDVNGSVDVIDAVSKQMRDYWKEISSVPNSSTIIPTPITSYTKYRYPMSIHNTLLLALKSDLDRSARFVAVDKLTGEEQVIASVGNISSRPILLGSKIYWTEIIPSLSWGQKNSSSIVEMEIGNDNGRIIHGRQRRVHHLKDSYFYLCNYRTNEFVAIKYDKMNNPHIVFLDNHFSETATFPIKGDDLSINGLCYDKTTDALYSILINENGTSFVKFNDTFSAYDNIVPPCYGTLTDLYAEDGKLYYTSINSGKDEVHIYDLKEQKEYRLTTSQYGSFASAKSGDDAIITTYTYDGYRLATQKIENLKECEWQKIPNDPLSYPHFKQWNVPKLDTIHFSSQTNADYKTTKKVKKYNKTLNSVNVHSWMPFYLDVNKMIDDRKLVGGWGVNLLSQNLLNSVVASFGYGRVNNSNLWKLGVKYEGLPIHLELNLESGGGKQETYNFIQLGGTLKNYLNIEGELSFPLNLSSGGNNRFFRTAVSYDYNNALLYKGMTINRPEQIGGTEIFQYTSYPTYNISKGLSKMTYSISFQNSVKRAIKDLNPRLGYAVQLYATANPFDNDFSQIYSAYGKIYVPGPFPHGSFTIQAAGQYQKPSNFYYNQSILLPRGVSSVGAIHESYSTSLDYRVPIAYPNGGIKSILHFQRISTALFVDYANIKTFYSDQWHTLNSYGGSLILDFNVIGIKNLFNVELSTFKPNNKKMGFKMTFNISI